MTCRSQTHPSEDIVGPFNGLGADLLIHGAEKPQVESPVTVDTAETNNPVVDDVAAGLTVELLDSMLQKQITTIVSIPLPSRLHFSRALKSALDSVLENPKNLASWIQLLLLPTCTLNLFEPKISMEERLGNRRKLQMDAINRALLCWKEPSGCFTLAQQLLGLPKKTPRQQQPGKKRKNTKLSACRRKLSNNHYTAAIRILSSNGLASPTPDTLFELQQKHSFARPPIIPA
ncbi:uncharacterized protein LOC113304283 [Papaver somniferum]|uniref:uncharacterized protein LOC113304283 n=1 Tax=Papaver somniferum TaxID=3469 RepID=UPI000E7049F6|nr:uncharacterized protein LOC113304283 [Papaver somniferum]